MDQQPDQVFSEYRIYPACNCGKQISERKVCIRSEEHTSELQSQHHISSDLEFFENQVAYAGAIILSRTGGMKEEKRERAEEKPVFPGKNMKKS